MIIETFIFELFFAVKNKSIFLDSFSGSGIEILQFFNLFVNSKWAKVSSGVNFPTNLSSLNTATPIFSIPFLALID